ncbi:hypothetical protein ACLOJK_018488 [Asimina triloba]
MELEKIIRHSRQQKYRVFRLDTCQKRSHSTDAPPAQLLSTLKGYESYRKTEPERIKAMKAGVLLLPLASLYSLRNRRLVADKKKGSSSSSFFPSHSSSAADEPPASFLLFPKSPSRTCSSSRSTLSKVLAALPQRRVSGRAAADVKSKPYEPSESVGPLEEEADAATATATIPWLEQFPKRWLIVFLCFSAFLLCNMDRVRNLFPTPI